MMSLIKKNTIYRHNSQLHFAKYLENSRLAKLHFAILLKYSLIAKLHFATFLQNREVAKSRI